LKGGKEGVVLKVDRIGLDIDDHNGLAFLIASLRAKWFGVGVDYYTNHGFHVDIHLSSEITGRACLDIRRMLGDDSDRIRIDEERLLSGEDLFRFDRLFEVRLKNGETYSRRRINALACGPYLDVGACDG
jgi:hypothetical protein